ncbi:MAG TPA: hypothetical protein VME21_01475 [Steroidobacteraceae bacterium]|nr:hypothetical protein [Steroidobacteraceae bacterium]
MSARILGYGVLAILLIVLLIANWHLLAASTALNLVIAHLTAPLIVLMLIIAALALLIDALAHAVERRLWGQERRALARQIEELRVRADQAEGSRLIALQATIERELAAIRAQLERIPPQR